MYARPIAMFSLGVLAATMVIGATVDRTPVVVEATVDRTPVVVEATVDRTPAPWTRLCGSNTSGSLDETVEQVSLETGVEAALLAAVMTKESSCNPDAVGSSGEVGLNQIHPRVWTRTLKRAGLIEEPEELFDPATNLRASAYILSNLLDRTKGDIWKALRRYNGSGPKARRYADSVYNLYNTLKP